MLDKIQASLIRSVAEILKVEVNDIDSYSELNEYGFDLVMLTEFVNQLNQKYKLELTADLLYEYPTIHSFAEYLAKEYKAVFIEQFETKASSIQTKAKIQQVKQGVLREKTLHQLKLLFGEVTKLDASKIDTDEPLENYGIDSMLIIKLNHKLASLFGELSKTLFFEYQTLRALTEYFITDYTQECMKWTGVSEQISLALEKPSTVLHFADQFTVLTSVKGRRTLSRSLNAMVPNIRTQESIAIIGISGRYPHARNLTEYWNNLKLGKNCISEIPAERWALEEFFHKDPQEAVAQGKSYSKWGGFVEGFANFDPLFFNISPREAINMDPQERMFIEASWQVFEDAGYTREQLLAQYNGRIGVFVGITKTGFDLYGPELLKQGEKIYLRTSFSSVANRISYLFNLQGPSMPIDTMCSSSLTAVHEACEHLHQRECEMALAGGVNLYLHPSNYIELCAQQMLSSDGQCKSFGKGGNGFVPGEGVGAVLLKPLSRAIADHNHIYAIIRSTSINHGGKTNGYTIPNPIAQSELIRTALDKAGVNARTISYIEAHGTGTELGDPIEITGLTQAFRKDNQDSQFCAIGSVKSNIGHLEAASGIAGITKIVLQMKNQMLVPSLHAEELNSNINFEKTPFVVQQELAEWKRPVINMNGVTREFPRIAGISSFGAGGSNAHVVIEEYIPENRERPTITTQNPAVIVLSARNEERLREHARQLLVAIREQQFSDESLSDMAYTLQIGREAMEERMGIIVGSIRELEEKLKGYVEGHEEIGDLFRGQVKRNKGALAVFAADEDMAKAIDAWAVKKKYTKLLDLWVKGLVFDWNLLYGDVKPQCISLPTYPFARERYWIPEIKVQSTGSSITTGIPIHPLLHLNTSDLLEQRFSSTFTGEEFFLVDHVIKGQRVLPGVAYLEMARAAVVQATGTLREEQSRVRIKNVVWARPIIVGEQPVHIHIGLYPEDNGEIAYEIYSEAKETGTEPIVYSQGRAVLHTAEEVPTLDIKALQAVCSQGVFSSLQCYEAFRSIGIEYGTGHQGIENIYVGSGQVLAKLCLPSSVSNTQDQFVLHPSIMDSALQASIGLMADLSDLKPVLPFALEEIEIFGNCTPAMWALIRTGEGSKSGDKVQKLDVDILDETGVICVRMKGFSSRVLEGAGVHAGSPERSEVLMLHPCWKEQAAIRENADPDYVQQLVILCEPGEVTRESIETRMKGVHCLILQSGQKEIHKRFEVYTAQIFEKIQSILKDKLKGQVLVQIVVSMQGEQQIFSGLSGLLKTARLENPKLIGQVIEVDFGKDLEEIIEKLKENGRCPLNHWIRYQDDKRWVDGWSEVEDSQEIVRIPWKDQGIYLITGGAGGLGLIFAKEISQRVKGVILILAGRSPLSKDKQVQLKELEALGARVEYRQVDVTRKEESVGLIKSICEDFGGLNGIIHSAGVIRDNFIIKKTKEELQEVIAPKITGLVTLDEASKDLSLDFFIFFSSIAGAIGNPGQADYATANAFMDAYAKYRNTLVTSKQRYGQTLSVNWPLWKDGGMHVDEETEKLMKQSMGMIAMQTSTGIRALYQSLASGQDQVMVLEGDLKRLRTVHLVQLFSAEISNTADAEEDKLALVITRALLQEKATNYFKNLLSTVIQLPANRIEEDASLEKYGIDSTMVMQMTNQLEKTFGSLPKTLFFEYQNIQELTGYFMESYRDQLTELLGIEEKAAVVYGDSKDSAVVVEPVEGKFSSHRHQRFVNLRAELQEKNEKEALDIAVIGVSGRYPKANNIQEFWENLRDGIDCITEIPEERWDHKQYFDENKNKFGKTYSKWGGFLEGVSQFDPLFFNISPREAEMMDPQERLFLECVYETLEDAGYTRESLSLYHGFGLEGNVGVYVGVMYEEYQLYGAQQQILGKPYAIAGNPSSIANRVSYFCNFHGPSMAVDTMCSSSMTAIHLACQSLKRGECELAIAGGVNVSIHPNKYLLLGQGNFVSSKGRCESLGQGGDGYVPGEGVGAVLLKPLSKAVVDGDHIYGVIKASVINHGGKTNGYTVPNPNAQASVIGRAFTEARINPRTISYIEAHGTGTSLGDPIEIAGLSKAFLNYTRDKQFCAIGSVKSNIGHCESAAGISGVTKVLLQFKYGQLVPSLHSKTLNPNIDFVSTPFVVQQELTEWKRPFIESKEIPRRAGVSSFGAGGSNAHVVIEEYIPENRERPTITTQNPAVIVLSARNEERLREHARQLLVAIREQQFSDESLSDMAYTLQIGREAMEERMGIIVGSIRELEEKLKGYVEGHEEIENLFWGQVKRNKEAFSVFAADEDMVKTIDAWVAKKKYTKLLDTWVKGLNINWKGLHGEKKLRRISLPTYPFAREHYWIPEVKAQAVDSSTIAASANVDISAESHSVERIVYFLKKQWELCLIASTREVNRTIAILATQETNDLAVRVSKHFPESHILDIYDLKSQLEQPEHNWKSYDGCIDLTGCGINENESIDWIPWLQKLIEYGHREGLMLLCVTKGLESYQNTIINVSGAVHAGLYRMLQSEYSHLRSRHMDADPRSDDGKLAEQIAYEFAVDSDDAEICYRNGKSYRAFFEELQECSDNDSILAFPEDHVLWITGGTRGLGLLCAQHFVTHYGVKRLVLTGRETIPPRDQWDSYMHHNTSITQKIKAIQALEEHGVHVHVLPVLLTDGNALQQSLQNIKDTVGPIGGVIHCAGLGDSENPAFIRKSLHGIQRVLSPKVDGLDVMYQSFKNEPLQFFVLFSSVSAIIPTLASGQSDYAMANAYMDYVAEAEIDNCPIVSIQWPSWKETGMGEVKSSAYQQTGLQSLTNAEGLQLLDRIIKGKIGPVVLPAVVNPNLWKQRQLMQRTIKEVSTKSVQTRSAVITESVKSTDTLLIATQEWLKKLFSDELKINPSELDMDTPFQDFGLDSILIVQVIIKIEQELKTVALEPWVLIEYPTIKSLAVYITRKSSEVLTSLFNINTSDKENETQINYDIPVISFALPKEEGRKSQEEKTLKEKIAVIGMACHFPDSININEFWENLKSGRDCIREVPKSRWDLEKYYDFHGYKEGKSVSKWGAFIEGIEEFDPGYFKISESLAPQIDPLQRQWLEVSAEALADAGYEKKDLWGKRIGVFAGARSGNFANKLSGADKDRIIGIGQNFISAHLAHVYNFKGPNMVIDTACSSSLSAIHLAVQSIQRGECEAALAGGVEILLDENVYCSLSAAKVLSPDGRCKTFDAEANGIGLGEGCGILLLKPLRKAIQDNDKIYGVIDGSAINNDGNTMGTTTPNPEAQQELIEAAIANADIDPTTISYVEAHGTGTLIGDPIELKGLTRIFLNHSSKKQLCGVGSLKSNIGHLLSAAGAASIIKVLLSLIHREIPPTLHCNNPNPRFNFEDSPLYIVQSLKKWTSETHVLRAGISAFGLGGNNAHVIVSNEGIPIEQRATLKPKGNIVVFNRKPYWPKEIETNNTGNNMMQEDILDSMHHEVNQFMELFQIKEM